MRIREVRVMVDGVVLEEDWDGLTEAEADAVWHNLVSQAVVATTPEGFTRGIEREAPDWIAELLGER